MYNFTQFAIELNELEEGIAPTDSRLRPDQRFMEDAKYDDANEMKPILEEKQIKKLKDKTFKQAAIWFREEIDPYTREPTYKFTNEYWQCKRNQDWSKCPDIF
jgi:hypothetical protein